MKDKEDYGECEPYVLSRSSGPFVAQLSAAQLLWKIAGLFLLR